jgi:hypothetical protein
LICYSGKSKRCLGEYQNSSNLVLFGRKLVIDNFIYFTIVTEMSIKKYISLILITALQLTFASVPSQAVSVVSYGISPRCQPDPKVPAAWKEYQKMAQERARNCLYTFRFVKAKLPKTQPKTVQTDRAALLPNQNCRLEMFPDWNKQAAAGDIINPNYKLLIIPFQTPDFKAKTNPQKDYKDWFKGMEDMVKNMSDVPSSFKIIIPDKYFMLPNTLKSYDVGSRWITPNSPHPDAAQPYFGRLAEDVVKIADPEIDFSVANHIWIVGPPNTKRSALVNFSNYRQVIQTNEKPFTRIYVTDHPYNYEVGWGYFTGAGPTGQLHEWMHSSGTLSTESGLSVWGLTAEMQSEMLAWDKWMTNMITDEQVRCAPQNQTTTHWLKPSSIKGGSYEKLLMIPLNSYQSVVVESIRSVGYNFKIPKCQTGVLIYTIDRHLHQNGFSLVQSPGKKKKCPYDKQKPAELAAFQPGESVNIWGSKITVVEAGDFGDVVRVEPGA